MKIVIAGSQETLAQRIENFLKMRGHEVSYIVRTPLLDGARSLDQVKVEGIGDCDALINLPEKMILEHRHGSDVFEKEFFETRINPTLILKEALIKAVHPPKVWISFSSVGCYPKEINQHYYEDDLLGEDPISKLIQKWEEAAHLPKESPVREVIPRLGLLISSYSGLLMTLLPLFKLGIGSIIGKGDEAFPWIYQKDLYWFLDYALNQSDFQGIFNLTAPQLIKSREFSVALSKVMHKPLWMKFPQQFFRKRLGDTAEIVFAKSTVFPGKLLKSGFEFRYPAIYPALVDCLNKGSDF